MCALSDQVFESMVIFSEYLWVGKTESNPNEDALPIPAAISEVSLSPNHT